MPGRAPIFPAWARYLTGYSAPLIPSDTSHSDMVTSMSQTLQRLPPLFRLAVLLEQSPVERFDSSSSADRQVPRVYCICSFQGGALVPTVELIDAETDDEAVDVAHRRDLLTTREVWDHHRLVARIPPLRAKSSSNRSPVVSAWAGG